MVLSHAASAGSSDDSVHSTFASRYVRASLPRFRMPENSIPKEAAYQIINDELMLDGNPRLNLASFVTTWMEPECNKLMMDSINENYVDIDDTPSPPSSRGQLESLQHEGKDVGIGNHY
uniref:Glutamate decarboxylase 1 n=2 Tax=Aegilops tauschii TaxID=37682 RepID=M8B209_AEGTA